MDAGHDTVWRYHDCSNEASCPAELCLLKSWICLLKWLTRPSSDQETAILYPRKDALQQWLDHPESYTAAVHNIPSNLLSGVAELLSRAAKKAAARLQALDNDNGADVNSSTKTSTAADQNSRQGSMSSAVSRALCLLNWSMVATQATGGISALHATRYWQRTEDDGVLALMGAAATTKRKNQLVVDHQFGLLVFSLFKRRMIGREITMPWWIVTFARPNKMWSLMVAFYQRVDRPRPPFWNKCVTWPRESCWYRPGQRKWVVPWQKFWYPSFCHALIVDPPCNCPVRTGWIFVQDVLKRPKWWILRMFAINVFPSFQKIQPNKMVAVTTMGLQQHSNTAPPVKLALCLLQTTNANNKNTNRTGDWNTNMYHRKQEMGWQRERESWWLSSLYSDILFQELITTWTKHPKFLSTIKALEIHSLCVIINRTIRERGEWNNEEPLFIFNII